MKPQIIKVCIVDNCITTTYLLENVFHAIWQDQVEVIRFTSINSFNISVLQSCQLLIIDQILDGCTGTEVLQQYYEIYNSKIPTILMSALPPKILESEVKKSKILDYNPNIVLLSKPFTIDDLKVALCYICIDFCDETLFHVLKKKKHSDSHKLSALEKVKTTFSELFTVV